VLDHRHKPYHKATFHITSQSFKSIFPRTSVFFFKYSLKFHKYMYLRNALFWVITQPVAVNLLPTFRDSPSTPSFSGSRILDPLKMGPIGCPETSVRNHSYSLRNNPEEFSSHLLRGGGLKSRKFCIDT